MANPPETYTDVHSTQHATPSCQELTNEWDRQTPKQRDAVVSRSPEDGVQLGLMGFKGNGSPRKGNLAKAGRSRGRAFERPAGVEAARKGGVAAQQEMRLWREAGLVQKLGSALRSPGSPEGLSRTRT